MSPPHLQSVQTLKRGSQARLETGAMTGLHYGSPLLAHHSTVDHFDIDFKQEHDVEAVEINRRD